MRSVMYGKVGNPQNFCFGHYFPLKGIGSEVRVFRRKIMSGGRQFLPLLICLALLTETALAGAGSRLPCYCNELGINAKTWRLHLFAKDPTTWEVIEGGAKGELTIERSSGRFTLTASGLMTNTEYALVRFEGDPPFVQVLARGYSDSQGDFSCAGVWQRWSRKFWVVPGKDLKENSKDFWTGARNELRTWHPEEYLFESEELP